MDATKDTIDTSRLTAVQPHRTIGDWLDASARGVLILPTLIIVLVLSIFPLFVSLYFSFALFQFVPGGFDISFIGLENYRKVLIGSGQRNFLGKFGTISPFGWLVLLFAAGILIYMLIAFIMRTQAQGRVPIFGTIVRVIAVVVAVFLVWLCVVTLAEDGLPGAVVVTLVLVFGGVTFQYLIGLGLGILLTQNLAGKRFFRITFLMPMMITPVGIAFLFRMLTDTDKGPLLPLWLALGLGNTSWANLGYGARLAVMIGDIWQWTPFMFIILLAALEGVSKEVIEAALVDGAKRMDMFRYIVLPEILPVSSTVILIRLIEAFKIIDLPQVLTGGGPGTATETLTLQAYKAWRAIDLGSSAAQAYLLLFLVTFCAVAFVNSARRRMLERL